MVCTSRGEGGFNAASNPEGAPARLVLERHLTKESRAENELCPFLRPPDLRFRLRRFIHEACLTAAGTRRKKKESLLAESPLVYAVIYARVPTGVAVASEVGADVVALSLAAAAWVHARES